MSENPLIIRSFEIKVSEVFWDRLGLDFIQLYTTLYNSVSKPKQFVSIKVQNTKCEKLKRGFKTLPKYLSEFLILITQLSSMWS